MIDNGQGIKEEVLRRLYSGSEQEHSYGLMNVHKRLMSIYGEQGGLDIKTSPTGTDISFCVLPEDGKESSMENGKEG